ncbi:unnamed protein product [Mytilus edulis]|uniref:MAPEG family protein n=1 Tax=Mytilus edulis TaxID=6550 RepID=A0A8S3QC59_MYTED|nr:unnamed protein product [Mytilus edulis]
MWNERSVAHTSCIIMSDKKKSIKKPFEENKSLAKKQIVATIVFNVLFFTLGKSLVPIDTSQLTTPTDRLIYTIRWLFLSSLTIMFAMFGVLRVRGNTDAIDPLNGSAENLVELPNRILRNTIEQFLLHASAVLTFSTFLDESNMNNIPLMVVLFILGRLFYAVGYSSAPMHRPFGFHVTFGPTFVTYIRCTYNVVSTLIF